MFLFDTLDIDLKTYTSKRGIIIFLIVLCSGIVISQESAISKYSIEYIYVENGDTTYLDNFDLLINVTSTSKKSIDFEMEIKNLVSTYRYRNQFIRQIEAMKFDLSLKKKSNFIKIRNNEIINFSKMIRDSDNVITTCIYKDIEKYTENYLNNYLFFLNVLLNDGVVYEEITLYSQEGTKLKYEEILSDIGDIKTYILNYKSHEEYCYNIYNCLYNDAETIHQKKLQDRIEQYERSDPKVKLRSTKGQIIKSNKKYFDKQLATMNEFYEKSLDSCLFSQEELSYKISLLKSSKGLIEIEKDLIIFPEYTNSEMYKSKFIINIVKYN